MAYSYTEKKRIRKNFGKLPCEDVLVLEYSLIPLQYDLVYFYIEITKKSHILFYYLSD